MAMYFGTSDSVLDGKNRFTFPALFRKDLSEKMYLLVTLGKYPHIDFFPTEEVYNREVASRKATMSRTTPAPILQALFSGNTDIVSIDKQGRTSAISDRLRKTAQFNHDLVVMGNADFISVYDLKAYDALIADANKIMASREEAMLSATYKEDEAIGEGAFIGIPSDEGGIS